MSNYCTNCKWLGKETNTGRTNWFCRRESRIGHYWLQSLCGNPTKLLRCINENWYEVKQQKESKMCKSEHRLGGQECGGYIQDFKTGALRYPAMFHPSGTMAELNKLIRDLGYPRVRIAHGKVDHRNMNGEYIILFDHDADNVDEYYEAKANGALIPDLLLVTKGSRAKGAVWV